MTKRTASTMRVRQPLTDLENEVMQAVWDGGTCTVEAVHRIVSRKRNLKEATVRTLLRRLEQKGYSGTSRTVERTRIGGRTGTQLGSSRRAANYRPFLSRVCRGIG